MPLITGGAATEASLTIRDDRALDLKDSQRADATTQAQHSFSALESSVRRAWSQILAPTARLADDGEPFDLARITLRNTGAKSVAQAVWDKVADEVVLEKLGRLTLADRLNANWPAGAEHLPLATIRDWFIQFVAFERLRDETVLAEALGELIRDTFAGFAYAEGVLDDGTYRGLVIDRAVTVSFDAGSVLVRKEVAEAQARAAQGAPTPPAPGGPDIPHTTGRHTPAAGAPAQRILRRFYGSVELDPNRPVRDLG